jgi:hypothetical protein
MAKPSPALIAFIGSVALYGAGAALGDRQVSFGGMKNPDFLVSWQNDPLLFGFGVGIMTLFGGWCLMYWWRRRK